jgi:hypothetical protein
MSASFCTGQKHTKSPDVCGREGIFGFDERCHDWVEAIAQAVRVIEMVLPAMNKHKNKRLLDFVSTFINFGLF